MSSSIFGQAILPQKNKFFTPRESAVGQLQQPRDKLFLRTPELRLNVRDIDPKTKSISIKKLKPVPIKLVNVFTGETERRILSDVYPDGYPKNLSLREQNLQLQYEKEMKALIPILTLSIPESKDSEEKMVELLSPLSTLFSHNSAGRKISPDEEKLEEILTPSSVISTISPSAFDLVSPLMIKEKDKEEEKDETDEKSEVIKETPEVIKKIDEAFEGLPLEASSIPYGTDDETKKLYKKQHKLWCSYKFYLEFTKLPRELQLANMSRFDAFEKPSVKKWGESGKTWRKINFLLSTIDGGIIYKAKEFNELMAKDDNYFKSTTPPRVPKLDIDI